MKLGNDSMDLCDDEGGNNEGVDFTFGESGNIKLEICTEYRFNEWEYDMGSYLGKLRENYKIQKYYILVRNRTGVRTSLSSGINQALHIIYRVR